MRGVRIRRELLGRNNNEIDEANWHSDKTEYYDIT